MGESIVLLIEGIFGASAGKIIGTFIISLLPVIELRGAIPVAFALGLNWQTAIICSIIGNLLPVPFILLFLDIVLNFMKKHNIFKKFVLWLEEKAQKNSPKVEKYGFWGLMIFTAIPLPGTGAWTRVFNSICNENEQKKCNYINNIRGYCCRHNNNISNLWCCRQCNKIVYKT